MKRPLSPADQRTAARISTYLGKGAGAKPGDVARLLDIAQSMLRVLGNDYPYDAVETSAYMTTNTSRVKLTHGTISKRHWLTSDEQRRQTIVHEAARYLGMGGGVYGTGSAARLAATQPAQAWQNPDSIGFALNFNRTDGW